MSLRLTPAAREATIGSVVSHARTLDEVLVAGASTRTRSSPSTATSVGAVWSEAVETSVPQILGALSLVDGAHGADVAAPKRVREDVRSPRSIVEKQASFEASAEHRQIYSNAEKLGIRAAFAAAARCGVLVYLDDTGTDVQLSATAYFMKLGYGADDLRPVNNKTSQCVELSKALSVSCINMYIEPYLNALDPLSVGGVWIDRTSNVMPMSEVRSAMLCARYVVTLTFTSGRVHIDASKACPNPATDQYARQVVNTVLAISLGDGLKVKDTWRCTSVQVYGAATTQRELNMINLQFQRRETLNEPLCSHHAKVSRDPVRHFRVVSNVAHERLYVDFEEEHRVSTVDADDLDVASVVGVGTRIGYFFGATKITSVGWYSGTVKSVGKLVSVSDGEHWQISVKAQFDGEEKPVKLTLDSFYYLSTPHVQNLSWVLLDDGGGERR